MLTRPLLGTESNWFSSGPGATLAQPPGSEQSKTMARTKPARKRKAAPKMRVNRKLARELDAEDERPWWGSSKRQKTSNTTDQVNVSLSRFAWQFVLRLLRTQRPSDIPDELRNLAKTFGAPDSSNENAISTVAEAAHGSIDIPADLNKENLAANESQPTSQSTFEGDDARHRKEKKPTQTQTATGVFNVPRALSPELEDLKPNLRPFRIGKDISVGRAIQVGNENADNWSEATCQSSGAKIHFQVCRDCPSSEHVLSSVQNSHVHLIGRAFADTGRMQCYSEEDAALTRAMLEEKDTISFSVWAFGSRRARDKTLAGTAVVTRAVVDEHTSKKVFVLALIAVDRQWRQYGIGRNLLVRVEKELREQEGADWMIAHGLRPNMYLKNGYTLDPRELPCPFKPNDRHINFFCKALCLEESLEAFKTRPPTAIQLCSDSLCDYYSEYQPKRAKKDNTGGPRDAAKRVTRSQRAKNTDTDEGKRTTDDGEETCGTNDHNASPSESVAPPTRQGRTSWATYSQQLTITFVNATNIIRQPRRTRQNLGSKRANRS